MRPITEPMNEWLDFTGKYQKHEADIMLKSGEIIKQVWGNGGAFHMLEAPAHGVCATIELDEVIKIKYVDYFKRLKHEQ